MTMTSLIVAYCHTLQVMVRGLEGLSCCVACRVLRLAARGSRLAGHPRGADGTCVLLTYVDLLNLATSEILAIKGWTHKNGKWCIDHDLTPSPSNLLRA